MVSCKKDNNEPGGNTVLNESSIFSECNDILRACTNGNGNYCLFGFKWGAANDFSNTGYNTRGPKEAGGVITYSFQEENGLVDTHAQINLPSNNFSTLPSCAKDEIRRALSKWEAVADLSFEEQAENSESDIRFFVADIRQSGIGYPNYPDSPCSGFAGNVIIKTNVSYQDCESFHLFLLHEIGHVLGLGHVETFNIMNPKLFDQNVDELQSGDIEGLVELYGEK